MSAAVSKLASAIAAAAIGSLWGAGIFGVELFAPVNVGGRRRQHLKKNTVRLHVKKERYASSRVALAQVRKEPDSSQQPTRRAVEPARRLNRRRLAVCDGQRRRAAPNQV